MTNKQIGGRGKRASYKTTHVRIPVDLKPEVELLIQKFRDNGNVITDKSDLILDESDNKFTDINSIKYRELLDIVINEFKENGLYIGQDDILKPRHFIPVLKEEAFIIASNLVKTIRTKKELAKILLSVIYGIETDDVNLD